MKKLFIILTTLLISQLLLSPVRAEDQAPKRWMVGAEVDLLPYIFDGYYISAVAGYGKWRARYVRAEMTTPNFVTQSGFDNNDLSVNAYVIDYYFKEGFKGWWVGQGFEKWKGKVREKNSGLKKNYSTDVLTFGGGYTFRFNDYFYINPWAAVHVPISGDKDVQFINETFIISATSEASIKIGVNF